MWMCVVKVDAGCEKHIARTFFFFFQAEDGIRDAQESRGLGDVYKRQAQGTARDHPGKCVILKARRRLRLVDFSCPSPPESVSYTHLTLPTIYSV